jgi:hypothetical protein
VILKENNFSNTMFENISLYKQAYNNLNSSRLNEPNNKVVFDDVVRRNINEQINSVK